MTATDVAAARRKAPSSLRAYDYWVLGQELFLRVTKEDAQKAEEPLKKATELDPQFARAYRSLGGLYHVTAAWGWGNEDPGSLREKAKVALLKSIDLDPADAVTHAILGNVFLDLGEPEPGLAELEKAYALNPNDPDVVIMYGGVLYNRGRGREGVDMVNRAFRLNPHYPPWYNAFAASYYAVGQYDQAIAMVRRTTSDVTPFNRLVLALSYAQLGRRSDTLAAITDLQRYFPDCSIERLRSDLVELPDQPTMALLLDGMRKAGLPECATQAELQKYPKMAHLAVCDAKRATN